MENYFLPNDIHLACIKAVSFPNGIMEAHENINRLTAHLGTTNHFGISYPHGGEILYMAGVESHTEMPKGCQPFMIKKGNYIGVIVKDYLKNIEQVNHVFHQLTSRADIDPNGCCVECYLPEGKNAGDATDIRCMVRLADQKQ